MRKKDKKRKIMQQWMKNSGTASRKDVKKRKRGKDQRKGEEKSEKKLNGENVRGHTIIRRMRKMKSKEKTIREEKVKSKCNNVEKRRRGRRKNEKIKEEE